MKNLGNYTSGLFVGNYSDVDRNFNKLEKRFGDSEEVSPWEKKGGSKFSRFNIIFSWWVTFLDRLSMWAKSGSIFLFS